MYSESQILSILVLSVNAIRCSHENFVHLQNVCYEEQGGDLNVFPVL